ncbi:MAG: DUF975 family protein [Bacilli bacterium]
MKSAKEYRKIGHERLAFQTGRLILIFFLIGIFLGVCNFSIDIDVEQLEIFLVELGVSNAETVLAIVGPIALVLGAVSWISAIASLLLPGPFALSKIAVCEKAYNKETVEYKEMFYGFRDFKRAFLASLLMDIYITLWSLISFGILGIVKAYAYSMTYYILKEDGSISAKDAITASKNLMQGKKMKLFLLELSYIGWQILSSLTFGILSLWVTPRMEIAIYAFFKDVDREHYGESTDDVDANVTETVIE